jgi:glycosyltransferase involved in cell wall biosynthesis
MTSKSISVIIPNYNYGRYLSEAIESALNQTYSNIEVIVVNNGSTDNSLEILRAYGGKIKLIDQQNLGQSGARNSGLIHAEGDYIAFLDADDYWHPTKIEKQVSLMSDKTELVYCGISRTVGSEKQIISQKLPEFKGDCSDYFLSKPGVSIVLSGESTAIFSRALFEKVGDFDRKLNSAAGWDFFRRCSKYTLFDYVPEPLVFYRLHDSNMSKSSQHNISDIRKAYEKVLLDKEWIGDINRNQRLPILLEYTFLKTNVRELHLKDSFLCIRNIWRLLRFRK